MAWTLRCSGSVLARGTCPSELVYVARFVFPPSVCGAPLKMHRGGNKCASSVHVKAVQDPDEAWASIASQDSVVSASIDPTEHGWAMRIGFRDVFLAEN